MEPRKIISTKSLKATKAPSLDEDQAVSKTIVLRVKRTRDDIGELQLTYDDRGIKRAKLLTEEDVLSSSMTDMFKPSPDANES